MLCLQCLVINELFVSINTVGFQYFDVSVRGKQRVQYGEAYVFSLCRRFARQSWAVVSRNSSMPVLRGASGISDFFCIRVFYLIFT